MSEKITEQTSFDSIDDFLKRMPIDLKSIDAASAAFPSFPDFPRWERIPEVGLVEKSYSIPGGGTKGVFPLPAGIDGSEIKVSIAADGSRTRLVYPDLRPRINSYGNSFTHCDQVNDGETWQEFLASHLREPIGNFGRGGGGVYEAYLRMKREEATDHGAENVILYIWGDDHLRTIAIRGLGVVGFGKGVTGLSMSNPHVYFDVAKDRFVEAPGLLPSRASLELPRDRNWIRRNCRNDLALQLFLFGGYGPKRGGAGTLKSIDRKSASALASAMGVSIDWSDPGRARRDAAHLVDVYGLKASCFVLDKAREFAVSRKKKLMVVLFDPYRVVPELIATGSRWDQSVVDHLRKNEFTYFDMNEVHWADFKNKKSDYDTYCKTYFVDGFGHYNGLGNSFFAYSFKPKLVAWLDRKPEPYLDGGEANKDDYLFNGRLGESQDKPR